MRLTHPKARASSAPQTGYVRRRVALASAALVLGSIALASAETYTVGLGGGCSHATLAAALTTAENHPGPDTIRITRSAGYIHQAINFTTSQELTLTGGFADCTTATEDTSKTTLDGNGDTAAPVLKITGNTGSLIRIRKLNITGGDVPSNGSGGGGIDYTGNGLLDIADTQITNNKGVFGGGISAGGLDDAAELDIGPGVAITNNTAYLNGGGVYSNNIETVIRGDDSLIFHNHALGTLSAGGMGGGIHIRACAEKSIVYLGSGNVLGVVSANDARFGGGIAIETPSGCSQPADLRLFSTSTSMTKISGNSASDSGGGIYISRAGGTANVYVWNAAIQSNEAPVAAAMYLGDSGNAYFNEPFAPVPPRPAGAVDCAVGVPCGYIRDNVGTTGPAIYGQTNNYLQLTRVAVTGNTGNELLRLNKVKALHSLVVDNIASSGRLVETHDGGFYWLTIAGNQVGGSQVFGIDTGGSFTFEESVAWQPGKSILHNDGGAPSVKNIVSNESASLSGPGLQRILVANPRFIDPFHEDYQLRAGSPAVDYLFGGLQTKDLLNLPRAVDLGLVADLYGPADVGAYERQALQPLVENSEFYGSANAWTIPNAAAASYDSSQNSPGSTGGSLHIKYSTTADTVVGAVQCIHLPSPGDYSLNGSGKVASGGVGNTHYAALAWELRVAGSETCTGIPDATGSKTLGATGNTWNRPATPVHIVVTPQQFTADTSIAVYLKINEGPGSGRPDGTDGPSAGTLKEGWIDQVTLSIDDPSSDIIFKNGFDGP